MTTDLETLKRDLARRSWRGLPNILAGVLLWATFGVLGIILPATPQRAGAGGAPACARPAPEAPDAYQPRTPNQGAYTPLALRRGEAPVVRGAGSRLAISASQYLPALSRSVSPSA